MFKKLLLGIQRYWLPLTIVLLLGVTTVSLIPLPELPELPGKDKTQHVIAYGILAFPVALARPKGYGWLLLGMIAWSGCIELIQPYVNRYGEWADLLANSAGVVLGWGVGWVMRKVVLV